jgi:hypothetical protein
LVVAGVVKEERQGVGVELPDQFSAGTREVLKHGKEVEDETGP